MDRVILRVVSFRWDRKVGGSRRNPRLAICSSSSESFIKPGMVEDLLRLDLVVVVVVVVAVGRSVALEVAARAIIGGSSEVVVEILVVDENSTDGASEGALVIIPS